MEVKVSFNIAESSNGRQYSDVFNDVSITE